MTDFRHAFDITPWDKSGNSFLGLNRQQAKVLGNVFIFTGVALADPPFSILPTDFLNIWLSGHLSKVLPSLSMEMALLLTYTFIAWSLILLGIYIYPYNTKSLFNGYMTKAKNLIKKVSKNPSLILFSLGTMYFIFNWYKGVI